MVGIDGSKTAVTAAEWALEAGVWWPDPNRGSPVLITDPARIGAPPVR